MHVECTLLSNLVMDVVCFQGSMYGYYDYGYVENSEYDYSNGYGQVCPQ